MLEILGLYLHRLVVDANCINAKGRLPAMTALEAYHDAGALELIVTSTLPVELDSGSIQAAKARLYQSVGAYPLFFPGEREVQSSAGAPVRPSLLPSLHTALFGRNLTGRALLRAIRDCLHLDQAQMNGADIFVTNDKRLHAAPPLLERHGVHLAIYTPDQALECVRSHYMRTIGKDNLEHVKARAEDQGPVILGSNSCAGCSFIAARTEETVARIQLQDGLLRISARFREENGGLLVELKPGERPVIPAPGASVTQVGTGLILVAEKPMSSVVVSSDQRTHLAVRMTHTGRAVVSEMELRDRDGRLVVSVQKESLVFHNASMRF